MDLDGDGHDDIITGSWPGQLYMFAGTGNGFRGSTRLKGQDGKDINLGNASAVYATDWDHDGDTDVVVGDKDGHVWFLPNESGDKGLRFGTAWKMVGGDKVIQMRRGNAGPTVADWNGDGTLDLIVGAGDGSVHLFANTSKRGAPALSASTALVAPSTSSKASDERCGQRVKPHVTDWNGDGRPDLLIGDFSIGTATKRELSEEQQAELEKLQSEMKALGAKTRPFYDEIMHGAFKDMGVEKPEGGFTTEFFQGLTDAQRKDYSKRMSEGIKAHAELKALQAQQREVSKKMRPLRPPTPVVGNVWVLLRDGEKPAQ